MNITQLSEWNLRWGYLFGVWVYDPRSMGLTLQEELRQHICSQDPCSKFQHSLAFLWSDLWTLNWLKESTSKCQKVTLFLGFLEVFSHLRVNIIWCGQDWTRIFCYVFFEFFLTAMRTLQYRKRQPCTNTGLTLIWPLCCGPANICLDLMLFGMFIADLTLALNTTKTISWQSVTSFGLMQPAFEHGKTSVPKVCW